MTLQQLFDQIAMQPQLVYCYFALLPITALITNFMSGKTEALYAPWKYLYSTLVYASCIPGIFAVVLCVHNALFGGTNLLNVNILVYFLPIIIMILTIAIIRRNIALENVPGFDRLSGLIMVLAATFIAMFVLQRTYLWIHISGSWQQLFLIFAVLFIVLKWGLSKIIK